MLRGYRNIWFGISRSSKCSRIIKDTHTSLEHHLGFAISVQLQGMRCRIIFSGVTVVGRSLI
eukprot:GSChrysophyteH1.ASY1.ANO1.2029.1 assembled CDS